MSRVQQQTAIDDARTQLAGVAARTRGRNTPVYLLLLGVLALLVSGAYAYVQWRNAQDQRHYAANAQRIAEDTLGAAKKLKEVIALEEQRGGPDDGPVAQLLTRLEESGPAAGLANRLNVGSRAQGQRSPGWVQQKITYTVNDVSLEAILKWIGLAMQQVPGLRVASLNVRLVSNEWSVNVQFTRWERTEGAS